MKTTAITSHIAVGEGEPLLLIAGPCVFESQELAVEVAEACSTLCEARGFNFVFKASFDKANRTSASSPRGPGLRRGLDGLAAVKDRLDLAITTDVHTPNQAAEIAEVVDLLQIPAFLCRQTDLLIAAARTAKPVNVKKGQFLAPWDMGSVVEKLEKADAAGILLTERGSTFGYNTLVVDFTGLPQMRELGYPVIFDASHSTQRPGGMGSASGGESRFIPTLARAATAVGVDGIFVEVHPDPPNALSDGPSSLPLERLPDLLDEIAALRGALP